MGDFFSKLLELFVTGNKSAIIKIIIFCVLIIFIIPLVTNYFYGNIRLEQQIKVLKELNSIQRNSIEDPRLKSYYDKILNSLEEQKIQNTSISITYKPPRSINDFLSLEFIIKFISGGIWWILLFFVGLFTKQDTLSSKIAAEIVMFILIIIFGISGMYIPLFDPFIINIIGFPLLQLSVVIFLFVILTKVNKKGKQT